MLLKVTLSVSNWHAYFFLLRLMQITDVAEFLVDRYFRDAWGLLIPRQIEKLKQKDIANNTETTSHEELFKERMFALGIDKNVVESYFVRF